ncbi:MAG: glutamate--tRNA ligase family protein [Candidatus Nanopelagicales bacterium]
MGGPVRRPTGSRSGWTCTREAAAQLLADGKAYHCYCTPEELEARREVARKEDRSAGLRGAPAGT